MKAEWIRGANSGESDEVNQDQGTSPIKQLCVSSVLLFSTVFAV